MVTEYKKKKIIIAGIPPSNHFYYWHFLPSGNRLAWLFSFLLVSPFMPGIVFLSAFHMVEWVGSCIWCWGILKGFPCINGGYLVCLGLRAIQNVHLHFALFTVHWSFLANCFGHVVSLIAANFVFHTNVLHFVVTIALCKTMLPFILDD